MADEDTREYKLIDSREKEMKPIFDRMDEDEKLYHLKPYKMTDPTTKKEVPDVVNVTFPDPQMFITKAQAIIGAATKQAVIEGEGLPEKQPPTIEKFIDDIGYMINERLNRRGKISLDSFIIKQICLRGRIAARSCIRLDEQKNLVPDVLPNDTRHFLCDYDGEDMVWGAPLYRRPRSQIEKQYPDAKVNGSYGEIRDFWDDKQNIVFVDKKIVKEQENIYKYPPFVESICPIGSELETADAIEHEGESILWPNRALYPEMNRVASLMQTLNYLSLFPGMQYENEDGEGANKPEKAPYGSRKVLPVPKGGGYKALPIHDIKNATRHFYSILEGRLQRASLTSLDYGNLTFPLSAVAYTEVTSGRNDIFLPRIQAIALFYQPLYRMIINQYLAIGKTLKLGKTGNQNNYSKADLKGDYTIKFRFFTQSKQQTAADLSIANAAWGRLPDDYILRELMGVQDPDGLMTQLKSQEAERLDEVLFLYRRACALLDEAEGMKGKERDRKEFEASLLGQRIATILRQRQTMGGLSSIEGRQQERPQGKESLPLFSGGQGGGRTATQREELPEQEEENGREEA